MYHAWKEDPESVHVSWRSVFSRMDAGALPGQSFMPPPTIHSGQTLASSAVPAGQTSLSVAGQSEITKVMQLIHAYQVGTCCSSFLIATAVHTPCAGCTEPICTAHEWDCHRWCLLLCSVHLPAIMRGSHLYARLGGPLT